MHADSALVVQAPSTARCVLRVVEHTSPVRAGTGSRVAGHGYRLGRIDKGLPPGSSLADLLSGESFDDNHRAGASGARPSSIPRGLGLLGCRLWLWNGVEELAAA